MRNLTTPSKKLERKLYRLKKREPSIPKVNKKQLIFFESRIGRIEIGEKSKLFKFWARISTLHKGERTTIPLHIYPYAEKYLKGWEIKSFQILYNYRLDRWEVHIVVKKEKEIKMINRWAFREFGTMLLTKIRENDGDGKWIGEQWTTHKCSVCCSKDVRVETGTLNAMYVAMKKTEMWLEV